MPFPIINTPLFTDLARQQGMQNMQSLAALQDMAMRQQSLADLMQKRQQEQTMRDMFEKAAQGAVNQPNTEALSRIGGNIADLTKYGPPNEQNMKTIGDLYTQAEALPKTGFDMNKFADNLMATGTIEGITKGMDIKKALKSEGFTLGEGQVRYGAGGEVIASAPSKVKEYSPTELSKLTTEMNALPIGDPRRKFYQDAITKLTTHAPAASAQVVMKQEGEEAKTVGKGFGEQYMGIQKSGLDASGKIARLDRMSNLLQGIGTGKLTPTATQIFAIADSFGIKLDPNLGTKQAIESLGNEIALEARNPSGGAGMPGALSDSDRRFLVNMAPGLSKTPEGNRLIIETARKLAIRDQEVAKLARDYRVKNKTIDEGFYNQLADYSNKHPLFSTTQQATGVDTNNPLLR